MEPTKYNNHLTILRHELQVALGCTEPIAIAYAAAKARQVLGKMPESCLIQCSGNIVKNVKGVTVPNSGGLRGIEVAAILGIFVFKISMLDMLGTITGGMTSTPGLAAADSMVDSNIPGVAYATVYPIAMVFLILFIQLIAVFL